MTVIRLLPVLEEWRIHDNSLSYDLQSFAVLTKVVQEQRKTIAELTEEMKEIKRVLRLKGTVAMVDTQ
jgi:hypothetical protein